MKKNLKNIFHQGPIPSSFIGEEIAKHSTKTEIGAHSIFLGQVRADLKEGLKVRAIRYTAYEAMVIEKMGILREDIFSRYSLICLHVYHSLGEVESGNICLFVFTSSKHRRDAMEACQEMVEKIKFDLPIWGEEILEDNQTQWKQNQ
jgi:molybdopterin synthase catalytic subunit